ncbi:MAG: RNA polymerase sigma factor [Phycisphaeraceae bacterium]
MTGRQLSQSQQAKAKQVVRPQLPLLLRVALSLTRHQQEAEDLVQETVLKAVRAIDSYRDGTSERAWLLTILRRAHVDRIRRSQRRVQSVSLASGDGIDPAAPESESAELWEEPEQILQQFGDEQLIEALRSLPEAMRWTLLLVDVEQLEHADAAEVLGVPEGTIKSRAHRGRQMLRKRLAEEAKARGWVDRPQKEVTP